MASPLCPDPDAFACESASAPQRRRKPRLIHMPRQPLPQLRNSRRPLRLLGNRSDSCKHNPNQNATSDPPNSTAISYEHEFVLALQCCNVNAGVTTAAFGDFLDNCGVGLPGAGAGCALGPRSVPNSLAHGRSTISAGDAPRAYLCEARVRKMRLRY